MRSPSKDPADQQAVRSWKPARQGDSPLGTAVAGPDRLRAASSAEAQMPPPTTEAPMPPPTAEAQMPPPTTEAPMPPPTAGAYASAQVREAAVSYLPELVFRLGPPLSDRLRLAAFARRRTPTAMATELLQRGLERESQRQRAEAALAILTPREREIARLAVSGHTNHEIAQALVISPETVKTHMRNLLGKFGLSSKAELRIQLRDLDRQP